MTEQFIDQFHFLRPIWLLIIPLALALGYKLRRRFTLADQWRDAISLKLLVHLTVRSETKKRLRPYQLMTVALVLGSLAMAGPTWQREITPFTQDRASLIVALELTPTMLGVDQPPTRLERAKQKIRDILKLRKGARTALIAYAGSAHAVLPLTDDAELIHTYLESLTPDLMPDEGDDASTALILAQTMFEDEQAPSTIIFMTDGIDRTHTSLFSEFLQNSTNTSNQVLFSWFWNRNRWHN